MVSYFFAWNMETLSGVLAVILHTSMLLVLEVWVAHISRHHRKHNGYNELYATHFRVFIVFP